MSEIVAYNSNGIPIKLSLIELLKSKYNVVAEKPLKDFCIIAIQHIQGTTIPLLEAVGSAGVPFHKMYLVSKAYSMHPVACQYLLQLGCKISKNEQMEDYRNPYEYESKNHIRSAINNFLEENVKGTKCLLLDEGGKAIRIIHEEYQDRLNDFYCVEQTTRGINEIKDLLLQCPVVNVARSNAKTNLEGPLIANSMCQNLDKNLHKWEHIVNRLDEECLIIGFGIIGRLLAKNLRSKGYKITIFDNNPETIDQAKEDGFIVLTKLNESIKLFSLVLGCTGTYCLAGVKFENLREDTLLVNCASSDIEFAAWELRRNAKIVFSREDVDKFDVLYRPWLNLYRGVKNGRHFYMANGGFPINFSGELDPINPGVFQLTRTLILLGLLQTSSIKERGIIPLDPVGENFITDKYTKIKLDGRGIID